MCGCTSGSPVQSFRQTSSPDIWRDASSSVSERRMARWRSCHEEKRAKLQWILPPARSVQCTKCIYGWMCIIWTCVTFKNIFYWRLCAYILHEYNIWIVLWVAKRELIFISDITFTYVSTAVWHVASENFGKSPTQCGHILKIHLVKNN